MSKINILYVVTKLELGGAQTQLLSIISSLDKQTYNVFLFTAQDGLLINEASAIERLVLKKSRFLERKINPFKDILALIEIYRFIKKNKIQIVHTHSSKAGILGRIAAKLSKVKIIIHTVHGWSFHNYQQKIAYYLYLFLERICARISSKIIVVSQWDKEKGLKNLIGRPEQYVLIRYGINSQEFCNQEKRNEISKSLGLSGTDFIVGTVACFKPQKSPLDFIKLAARVKRDFPDIKFVMVGDGALRKQICAEIKKLNLNGEVILAGWRKDVSLILSCMDIFVLTSLWEGLPIAVLEAMAAGVPIIATDTGGIREVIKNNKTGYLVQANDLGVMQNRVEELFKNKQKRTEFAGFSKQLISSTQDFSLNRMISNTQAVYQALMEINE